MGHFDADSLRIRIKMPQKTAPRATTLCQNIRAVFNDSIPATFEYNFDRPRIPATTFLHDRAVCVSTCGRADETLPGGWNPYLVGRRCAVCGQECDIREIPLEFVSGDNKPKVVKFW